jgi:DNA invertase Pin-like site-specific DNA recombinase
MEDLQEEMIALEKAGCERIVVDSAAQAAPQGGMLPSIIARLNAGDVLVTWNLQSVADSIADLITLVLQLDAMNVRFRSLTERFDTHGPHRTAIPIILSQLQEFERTLRHAKEVRAGRSRGAGRPRALSSDNIRHARLLVKQGRSIEEVAREFNVSRGTLYRYLGE